MQDGTVRMCFINGAIRQVAKGGIENLRTKSVAEETQYSEATLFREFSTKADLLRAAFLEVDRRVSSILTDYKYEDLIAKYGFMETAHEIWKNVFHYLIEHQEEMFFLIRFRFSSLYSEDVRSKRQAYNGAFDRVYTILNEQFGGPVYTYQGFIINYVFELTLSFAEKISTGRVSYSQETENRIWMAIQSTISSLVLSSKNKE